MRPTGKLHLGHLVGALKNWVALQEQYDCFYFVADWHALTSEYADTSAITGNALDNVADWIAAGVDPERSTIFIQSLVPEHAELSPAALDGRADPMARARADLQGAAGAAHGEGSVDARLPRLPAPADGGRRRCTTPGSCRSARTRCPHLELSREVVRRFHQFYGEMLVEPQPLLTPVPRLPGLDNRKMSKSYGNTIDLTDDAEAVVKKVRQMYTDPKRIRADIPGTVEGNPVFLYHDAFNPNAAEVEDLKARYRAGKVGDVEVKTKLAAAMNAVLEPMRERRREVMARPERIREIAVEGSRTARVIAQRTMERVRDAVKLRY